MSYIRTTRCEARVMRSLCLDEARALFRQFHRFPAPQLVRRRCRRSIPPVLVHLGSLKGLIYTTDKERRGRSNTYIHFMERPPLLACDPQGTQLYVLGGSYRVTPRGIEG